MPAPHAGKVTKVHVKKKQTVEVGNPLISIETEETAKAEPKEEAESKQKEEPKEKPEQKEEPATKKEEKEKEEKAEKEPAKAITEPARQAPPVSTVSARAAAAADDRDGGDLAPAGPAVRRFARELGVDLHQVSGTGPGGRITREDVMAAVRQGQTAGGTASRRSLLAMLPRQQASMNRTAMASCAASR